MSPKSISHYDIEEELGRGGMGIVYKAHDRNLDRTVALKVLPDTLSSDPEAKSRFLHEGRAASALDHSNICTIYEIGESEQGQLFIAPSIYKEAVCDEALGDYESALKNYRLFIEYWRDADEDLQPVVDEARAGIERVQAAMVREPAG